MASFIESRFTVAFSSRKEHRVYRVYDFSYLNLPGKKALVIFNLLSSEQVKLLDNEDEQILHKITFRLSMLKWLCWFISEIFEGDMVMSPLLRRAVLNKYSKRSALVEADHKWPGGIVPYELDSSLRNSFYMSYPHLFSFFESKN